MKHNNENKYLWVITVNDGYGSYEYKIDGAGDKSSDEVAKLVSAFLRGRIIEMKPATNELAQEIHAKIKRVLKELQCEIEAI